MDKSFLNVVLLFIFLDSRLLYNLRLCIREFKFTLKIFLVDIPIYNYLEDHCYC